MTLPARRPEESLTYLTDFRSLIFNDIGLINYYLPIKSEIR